MPSLLSRPRRGPNGHNLLEVIVATFIFLVVLIFMTGIWKTHNSALTQSRNHLVATALARSILEQRMAAGYGSLDPLMDTPQVQTFVSRSQVRGRQIEVQFKTTFLVTQSAASTVFRRLVATIEWRENSGEKKLSYESCLFKTN